MAEPKTKLTKASVEDYLNSLPDQSVADDCRVIAKWMEAATGAPGEMWGPSIVGFGRRMVQYAGGKQQEWMVIGFSPRKANLTLYIPGGFEDREDFRTRLGSHSCGKGCLYVKKLSSVDNVVLEELIHTSVKEATPIVSTGQV